MISTTVLPLFPLFVVTNTTPLDARDPYIAAAEASFNISIDEISLGFSELIPLLLTAPSIIYRGSVEPKVPAPRINILTSAPASPPFCKTSTPGVRPWRAEVTLEVTNLLISFAETEATDAVILDFFCTP